MELPDSEESNISINLNKTTSSRQPISNLENILIIICLKNLNIIILAHLNINSIWNKFDSLVSTVDVSSFFLIAQIHTDGYATPYGFDRDINDDLLLFRREDILSSLLNSDEGYFVKLNLRKRKWLLYCSYNPHKNQISNHLKEIERNLDVSSANYDNLLLLGELNVVPTKQPMKAFCLIYNCTSIIMDKTCYKNPENL